MHQFQVEDMTCGHCISRVTKAIKDADANAMVVIDLKTHAVQVDSAGDAADFQEAIREAGYTAVLMAK